MNHPSNEHSSQSLDENGEKNKNLVVDAYRWSHYVEMAKGLGFTALGAAKAEKVDRAGILREWVEEGCHADMHWFARGLEKRLDPALVMEDAASIFILTTPYNKEPVTVGGKKLARYACGEDYHDVLIKPLRQLCEEMAREFPGANLRAYVDTGPVLERYWAEKAGLGWIGKNGNLINRKAGSYLFLASIVTNLTVPYGQPHANFCGSCTACLDACPTGAFVSDGIVDSRKCISYLNIEHRGPFQDAPNFADWIFGCDICQEVCPWPGKFSGDPLFEQFLPRPQYEAVDEVALAAMDQETFSATFRKSPVKRTKRAGIQRNLTHLQQG